MIRPACCVAALVVVLAMTPCSAGETRLDGFFDFELLSEESNQVRVVLTLRLFNHGSLSIEEGSVELQESLRTGETFGSFDEVSIAVGDEVELSAELLLPRREFEYWDRGGRPMLYLRDGSDEETRLMRVRVRRDPQLVRSEP